MNQNDLITIQRMMAVISPMGFSLVTSRTTPEGDIIVEVKKEAVKVSKPLTSPVEIKAGE